LGPGKKEGLKLGVEQPSYFESKGFALQIHTDKLFGAGCEMKALTKLREKKRREEDKKWRKRKNIRYGSDPSARRISEGRYQLEKNLITDVRKQIKMEREEVIREGGKGKKQRQSILWGSTNLAGKDVRKHAL